MKRNERIIQYFDASISTKTRSKGIPQCLTQRISLDELMKQFQALKQQNDARSPKSKKSNKSLQLQDICEANDQWVLLVNIVDGNAPSPVINTLIGDNIRETINLNDNQGIEQSAHVTINKEPNSYGKHLLLIERNTEVQYKKIISLFNSLCRKAAAHNSEIYKIPHPTRPNKSIKTYCFFSQEAHLSEEFKEELITGTINDLEITSPPDNIKGYDSTKHQELKSSSIKVSTNIELITKKGGNLAYVERALFIAKELDGEAVKIKFKDQSGSSHATTIKTDSAENLSIDTAEKYIKRKKIDGFTGALTTAFTNIHTEIARKMLELANEKNS